MNQRTIQFLIELNDLLTKHGVEVSAEDHYQGYPECGEDIRIEFYSPPRERGMSLDEDGIDVVTHDQRLDADAINTLLNPEKA